MTYSLWVKFKSNEAPWSGGYEPNSWHQPADDVAAIKWAADMSSGLGSSYIVTLTKDGTVIPLPATAEDCVWRKCTCRSATECKFTRCKNCNNIINAEGKTMVDHSCEEWDTCPDCGGPLNERRVYGALAVS